MFDLASKLFTNTLRKLCKIIALIFRSSRYQKELKVTTGVNWIHQKAYLFFPLLIEGTTDHHIQSYTLTHSMYDIAYAPCYY